MAKKSMIARELKRAKLVAKQAEKRKALKAIVRNISTDEEGCRRQSEQAAARRQPDASAQPLSITGRPHGVNRVRPRQQAARSCHERRNSA